MKYSKTYKSSLITAAITMAIFGCVTVFSCSKSSNTNGKYTVTGTVYEDCNRKPFSNQQLQLVHIASSGSCTDQLLNTYTDNNGNFSFTYSESCKEYLLSDEYQIVMLTGKNTGNTLYTRIPGKQDVSLSEMYAYRKNILPVKIFGVPSPNKRDTLFVGISEDQFIYFYPIRAIDTALTLTPAPQIYGGNYNDLKVYYANGMEYFKKVINDPAQHNSFNIQDPGCSGRAVDTLKIPLQ